MVANLLQLHFKFYSALVYTAQKKHMTTISSSRSVSKANKHHAKLCIGLWTTFFESLTELERIRKPSDESLQRYLSKIGGSECRQNEEKSNIVNSDRQPKYKFLFK